MTNELRIYARNAAKPRGELPAKLSEHFAPYEFQCGMEHRDKTPCPHCGGLIYVTPNLIVLLERIRERVCEETGRDTPLTISSGYRCPDHNSDLPGSSSNSRHMVGVAADIERPAGISYSRFYQICDEETRKFNGGVGRYTASQFVHVDTDCTTHDRRWGS